ncbi:hypothetical protein GJAV_G00130750 [Gymnothorax javanicus]|nr:hypothetical protein GJAV_G00130750 [Gymnothorax javanicus]
MSYCSPSEALDRRAHTKPSPTTAERAPTAPGKSRGASPAERLGGWRRQSSCRRNNIVKKERWLRYKDNYIRFRCPDLLVTVFRSRG